MFNMLMVDICAKNFGGLGGGICALLTQIMFGLLQLVCKLLGTFVDLLNIAFYIFAGVDFGGGRFNIIDKDTQESMNILDYFIFNESVTKTYLYLALIAVGLVVVFTIYKIIKQDYFDKAGPRSKGPIFRNVAISCISFILVIPIFYLIIHASSFLALSVQSAMGMDPNVYAGMQVFSISWSDGGDAMHEVNNMLSGVNVNAGSVWYIEEDLLFTLLADGDLVSYDKAIIGKVVPEVFPEPDKEGWTGTLATLQDSSQAGSPIKTYKYYTTFYWYIYLVAIIVALKAMWNLVLAMIQRIFKLLGLFLVAPAPISQYVLDDGAKYKEWLKKSIEEGLRLVVACFSFSIFLLVLGTITSIDFSSAFSQSLSAASGGRAEVDANVSASTLVYSGEFAGVENIGLAEGDTLDCGLKEKILVNGEEKCGVTFFESLINAFLQCLLVVAAGGAIKDLDTVVSPLISGAQSSLDSGNTGGAVNAVGKAAMAVASSTVGGVVGGAVGALKNRKAEDEGASKGADDEEKDADKNGIKDDASSPTEGGTPAPSAPTEGPTGGGDGDNGGGDGGDGTPDGAAGPEGDGAGTPDEGGDGDGGDGTTDDAAGPEGDGSGEAEGEGSGEAEGAAGPEGEGTPGEGGDAKPEGEGTPGEGGDAKPEGTGTPTPAAETSAGGEKKTSKWWALAGDKDALKEVGKSIAGSKLGKFVGGMAKKAGGLVSSAVGGAKKLTKKNLILGALATTAKVGFRAAKRGLGQGLKTAGGAIATAVVGEGAVKSFLGAKGDAQGKENEAGKKKYDAAKTQAFNEKREARLSRATENLGKKEREYNGAVSDLHSAVESETQANKQLGEAQQEVVDSRALVDTAMEEALGSDSSVVASRKTIDEKTQDNQAILDKYSKKYGREIKSLEDLKSIEPSSPQARKAWENDVSKFEANSQTIQTAKSAIQAKRTALETGAGISGPLAKLFTSGPLKGMENANIQDVRSTLIQKKAEQQAIIDSKGPNSEEGRAAQQQLAELESAHQAVNNLSKGGWEASAQIRREQARLTRAETALGEAEKKATEAHEHTEKQKTVVAQAAQAHHNAQEFVAKHNTEGFRSNNQQQYAWDPAMKGSERRRIRAQDRRKAAAIDRVEQSIGESEERAGKVTGTVKTKKIGDSSEYFHGAEGFAPRAQQRYEQARKTFAEDPAVSDFLTRHNITVDNDGYYDIASMNSKLSRDKTLTPQQRKEIRGKIMTYSGEVTSLNNTKTYVGRMETIQQQGQNVEQRMINNQRRFETLQHQGTVVTQVLSDIDNGGFNASNLSRKTISLLNRQSNVRVKNGDTMEKLEITENSTPEQVRAVAESAQARIRQQQVRTIGQSEQLAQESTSLKNAFDGLVQDLINGVRSAAANMPAPQGTNTPEAPKPGAVETPVQTPVTSVPSSFEPFAGMANKGPNLSEADYERIQSEGIRANQALLNQIREQNKGIINTVEDIEREVKGDS